MLRLFQAEIGCFIVTREYELLLGTVSYVAVCSRSIRMRVLVLRSERDGGL